MSFRYRLALFLVVTLASIQVLTAMAAYVYLRASLVERAKNDLIAATHNFIRQLDVLSERATSEVKVLSLDYALRQAIAQQDHGTELSALRNHGKRVGATRMILVGLDGTISADTGSGRSAGRAFPFPAMLNDAVEKGQGNALAVVDGRAAWIVAAPVRAPIPIASIVAFIPVDRAFLEKLRDLSTVPRSIALATRDARGRWHVVGRTANGPSIIPLPQARNGVNSSRSVESADGEYITVATRLPVARDSAPVLAVLSYPLSEAFAAYRAVIVPVLVVLALALLAAMGGAFFVIRRASKPLEALGSAARRIAQGDYTPPPQLDQTDEIGQLSQALTVMAKSIAQREAALTSAICSLELARNEAVTANQAKSQFLANMSHELRTPLNAIVGFGEMIFHQVLGPLGVPRYGEYARDICTSGQHLLALVSRMLDLADVEAGRLEIVRRPQDAGELLAHSVAAIMPLAEKAGIQLDFAPARGKWPLEGDAGKLREVFKNVLHNAVKFTPAGGRVDVRSEHVEGRFTATVTDTGVGMRPEDVALVTRPFHRLRGALDGEHQGAGLGLPYAHAITELHGGRLSITSHPGTGTTVTVTLPLAKTQAGLAA